MEYIEIGNDKVSVIGLGTHLIGGKSEPDFSRDNSYVELIRKAISLGINHIDTAEIYGKGHAEEIIGKAIEIVDRKKVFIASKVWTANLRRFDLISSLKATLRRLKTNYLDLYYIHRPNPEIDLRETMEVMEEAKSIGLIRNIGLSNFSQQLIEEAQSYLKDSNVAAIQVEYNLLNREAGTLLDFCEKNKITLVAYKPLLRGKLAELSIPEVEFICRKYNKTPVQVALNWLVLQKNVIVIPRISSFEHLTENLGSLGWKLRDDDFNQLSSIKQPNINQSL